MKWSNVILILQREIRDQLRDRRTLFTIAVLPLLLYPLLGMIFLQFSQQFMAKHPTKVWIIGAPDLPEMPKLIEDGRFSAYLCTDAREAELLKLTIDPNLLGTGTGAHPAAHVDQAVNRGEYDVAVYFPPDFAEKLQKFCRSVQSETPQSGEESAPVKIPSPHFSYDKTNEKSVIANSRVGSVIRRWREEIVRTNFQARHIPMSATQPFQLEITNVAPPHRERAAMWSRILPFVVFIWALTGAFYPAIDLCAGEKERGTLETLLSSPAGRGEIVWGKLLAITLFSMATSLLNLASMGVTGLFVMPYVQGMGLPIGPPPLLASCWLLLALVPMAALFSALSLGLATMARSTKEGQYYLMPLLMLSMPLMILPVLPGAELNFGTSLIPITGMMLLLRALMEGQYLDALRYVLPVVGVTAGGCLLSIRWAIDQFNNESVLFRESEQLSLRLWLRRLIRDRRETPTATAALLFGALLVAIRFLSMSLFGTPNSFQDVALSTVIPLVGLFALPAVLAAVMLTRSPRKTLLLKMPPLAAIPVALLLAVVLHPLNFLLAEGVQKLYPMSDEMQRVLADFAHVLADAPVWQVLLVFALVPAVCEELAFRGFILSGLRRSGRKWGAILLSSVFFGITHGILQQSITACIFGALIGYLAVQTGSLLPGILFHLAHNSLSFTVGRTITEITTHPGLMWMVREVKDDGYTYSWAVVAASAALAVGLLFWLHRLPYQATDEEKLLEARDHRSIPVTSR